LHDSSIVTNWCWYHSTRSCRSTSTLLRRISLKYSLTWLNQYTKMYQPRNWSP
jgi:hypothetical protein